MDALITSVLILMVAAADYMGKSVRYSCNKVIVGIFVAAICLSGICSQEGNGRHVMGERVPYAALRAENEALRIENEALRRENQMLRRELVARKGRKAAASDGVPVKGNAVEVPVPQDPDTGYWISSKSHIRHNPKCRSYRKVRGRACGPNDGKPCKNCGG